MMSILILKFMYQYYLSCACHKMNKMNFEPFPIPSLPTPEGVTSSYSNGMPISPEKMCNHGIETTSHDDSFEARIAQSRNNSNKNNYNYENNQISHFHMQKLMLQQQQNRSTHVRDEINNMTTMPITKNDATNTSIIDVNKNNIEQNLIMVCNSVVSINDEDECDALICMIIKCVKDDIWPDIKFLSNNAVRSMTFHDRRGFEKSVIGKLLHRTRQHDLNLVQRIRFWKKYSGIVQRKLNDIKTTRTKSIKDEILKGTY